MNSSQEYATPAMMETKNDMLNASVENKRT
jgi:hypothetical protein